MTGPRRAWSSEPWPSSGLHTHALLQLTREVFATPESDMLHRLAAAIPINFAELADFDDRIPGPSLNRLARAYPPYPIGERDVFRPLQYCAAYLSRIADDPWATRYVVEMSAAHLEALIKRIGGFRLLPLGRGLRERIVQGRLDSISWQQLTRFAAINNEAKHRFDHSEDTHLFSMRDAVLAYAVARQLALRLYMLAGLATDWPSIAVDERDFLGPSL